MVETVQLVSNYTIRPRARHPAKNRLKQPKCIRIQGVPGTLPRTASITRSGSLNLARRLQKHKEGCLRFLTDLRTPFTNNEAERDIRMNKVHEKISGGFRSLQGACNFAGMRSVIVTARKQGWNILQILAHPEPMQLIPILRS